MKWNWEQKDWPNFRYDSDELAGLENRFLKEAGMLLGAFKHLNKEERETLTISLISEEALKTSEIEGEFLNRESLQSSIRKQLGLQSKGPRASAAEQGIAEMMVKLYRNFGDPLNKQCLLDWNSMILKGRKDLKEIGCYRKSKNPMQIVSGPIHNPRVHFEAPPANALTREMNPFYKWLESSKQTMPILTRAGIAHAWFVSIHPFEDGNGRIARAITEKSISDQLGNPTLIALAQTIEANKKAYYDALEQINRSNEITAWLLYFANTLLTAQQTSTALVEFSITKAKFYDRFSNQLNERQTKAISRIFKEGIKGFQGGLSAENYLTITQTSRATATRDLADLVKKSILNKTGQLKHSRYHLNFK